MLEEKADKIEDQRIICAVSGGVDSVSLLHWLVCCGNEIFVAHVNHNLRGAESFRDECFVHSLCMKYGPKLFVKSVDIKKEAKEKSLGLEEYGRMIRYAFFSNLSKKLYATVALAHTLSDSLETVIFNFVRGTGLKGLCGIPAGRDEIIRPFIKVTRGEIEDYAKRNGLEYITDSSNFCDEFSRNKIRLKIIPVLKEINPSFEARGEEFILRMKEDNDFFESCVEKELAKLGGVFEVEKIKNIPLSIRKRVLRRIFGDSVQSRHIALAERLIRGEIGGYTLPRGRRVRIRKGVITIYENVDLTKKVNTFRISRISSAGRKIGSVGVFYYGGNKEELVFRRRLPGDRFTPKGRVHGKLLRKYFNELGMPPELRGEVMLLAVGNEVIWVDGIGVSEKFNAQDESVWGIFQED